MPSQGAHNKGGKRYFSWDVKGIPDSVVKKFSRRAGVIDALADRLGIENPVSKDKLGGMTRLHKLKDMTLDDYRTYWDNRITPDEWTAIDEAIDNAREGISPLPLNTADKGVQFAIGHEFERRSVIEWYDLAITAMEHCMGGARPEEIQPEAIKQGVLLIDGEATTKEVLAEETRVIAFAREGKGTCGPMGKEKGRPDESGRPLDHMNGGSGLELHKQLPRISVSGDSALVHSDTATPIFFGQQKGRTEPEGAMRPFSPGAIAEATRPDKSDPATPSPKQQAASLYTSATSKDTNHTSLLHDLSPDQLRIAHHVWDSTDRVILIRGAAGTGKTHTMRTTIEGLDRPVVVLAPSAEASRGVLRREGFTQADTVARFLQDSEFRQQARNGVIWVDEAGQLGIRQVAQLFDHAKELNARVVLQGDRRQHGSVERGATLRVLEEFAGLPVAELRDIRRQRGQYKSAVEALAKGKMLEGYDHLTDLGWIKHVEGNTALVDDYLGALKAGKSVLVVAPTHAEGDSITGSIRTRLKQLGVVREMDQSVEQLRPLNWTEAERGDLERYDGSEVVVFHRNSGTFKAGQRVRAADWKPGDRFASAAHFSVYEDCALPVAAGDTIRITGNGKTKDGHKLNNGSVYEVKGFSKHGEIVLENNWVVPAGFGHLAHGYVSTSHASQGKTVDRVLIAMGKESLPAMGAEQFYVSVSRGRESAKVYSDLDSPTLREAIRRVDNRKTATELMAPKPKKKSKLRNVMKQARERFKRLHEKVVSVTKDIFKQKERDAYER